MGRAPEGEDVVGTVSVCIVVGRVEDKDDTQPSLWDSANRGADDDHRGSSHEIEWYPEGDTRNLHCIRARNDTIFALWSL
jgi:hypothetical protein